jgi:hypothetical protein
MRRSNSIHAAVVCSGRPAARASDAETHGGTHLVFRFALNNLAEATPGDAQGGGTSANRGRSNQLLRRAFFLADAAATSNQLLTQIFLWAIRTGGEEDGGMHA